MDGLIAICTTLMLVAPLHFAVRRMIQRQDTPAYLREVGVVILNAAALDARGDSIGSYAGEPIHGTVTFKGMGYAFDRIVPPGYRHRIVRDELFLDPGLVYLAQD